MSEAADKAGEAEEKAGLVFIVPPSFDVVERGADLRALIAAVGDFNLAAFRLGTAGLNRGQMVKRGDALREIAHEFEISVLLEGYAALAKELGFDGVHLHQPSAKELREARKILGNDAIYGVHAGVSKHEGMVLGEIGVDYVSYGPIGDRGLEENLAEVDLFAWWSEMIELPLVAEGGVDAASLEAVKDYVDFVGLGEEIFNAPEPVAALTRVLSIL